MLTATRRPTEQVLGSELREGDTIWVQGYRWTVRSVAEGTFAAGTQRRYCVEADFAQGNDGDPGPGYTQRPVNFGLRVDLNWTREVAA